MEQEIKDTKNKLRWDLLPLDTIKWIVEVYTYGAEKYKEHGRESWKKQEDGYNAYKAALFRHLEKHDSGRFLDEESNLPHLAHVAWNAVAMLYFGLKEHDLK